MVDAEYRKWFLNLITLPYGFIFISHTKSIVVEGIDYKRTKFVSGLADRAKKIVLPPMSVVAHMYMGQWLTKGEDGKLKSNERRIINFKGGDIIEAGDGEGYLPDKLPVLKDSKKMYEVLKGYYSKKRNGENK